MGYLIASAALLMVHLIYAQFSHQVSSPFMTWMFLVPLFLGALPCCLLMKLRPAWGRKDTWRMGTRLYAGGMAALVNGMMLRGVMDIAGTASPYILVFWLMGGLLMLTGIISIAWPERKPLDVLQQ